MANSWNETIAQVNKALSDMSSAASAANGAAAAADEQTSAAQNAAEAANAAAQEAQEAAESAEAAAKLWGNATLSAVGLEEGNAPTVTSTLKEDGSYNHEFGIPVGATGEKGDPGPAGESGVTFRLDGTKLYITMEG